MKTAGRNGGSVCESNTPLTGRARQTPVLKTLRKICRDMKGLDSTLSIREIPRMPPAQRCGVLPPFVQGAITNSSQHRMRRISKTVRSWAFQQLHSFLKSMPSGRSVRLGSMCWGRDLTAMALGGLSVRRLMAFYRLSVEIFEPGRCHR